MKLDSLTPLAGLSRLGVLHLLSLRVADLSLRPLHGLTRLRALEMVGTFPTEEYARLAAALPRVDCLWFAPYVTLQGSTCERCGGQTRMLTGKRRWRACERCDARRVEEHVEDFERIRQAGPNAPEVRAAGRRPR